MTGTDEMLTGDEPEDKSAKDMPEIAGPKVKRWLPEASAETAGALRKLAVTPWLVAGRDDAALGAVRRNLPAIREVLARLGWVLVVERDFARLRKSAPVRREAWVSDASTQLQGTWFFLLVAGAESVGPRIALSQLVEHPVEFRTARLAARCMIGEDRGASRLAERILLERSVLV